MFVKAIVSKARAPRNVLSVYYLCISVLCNSPSIKKNLTNPASAM